MPLSVRMARGSPEVLERALKHRKRIGFLGGRQRVAGDQIAAGKVGDRQRIAVAPVGEHELALVVGAPELVRGRRPRERRALGLVAAPAPTRDQTLPVEDGVHGADGRARQGGIPPPEFLPDLRGAPAWILSLEPHNQLLDLHRKLVRLPVGPPAAVRQPVKAAVLVPVVDLVAGLAGNTEFPTEASHLLAIEQPGNEAETFFHDAILLPGHHSLPSKRRKCYPCLRNEVSPFSREGHRDR